MPADIAAMSVPGVIVIPVPLPKPGSVSIKYSAAVMFCGVAGCVAYEGLKSYRHSFTTVILQAPSLFFVRINRWCTPLDKPLVFTEAAMLATLMPADKAIAVPLPNPGSVSMKYSAAIMFCGAAGTVG